MLAGAGTLVVLANVLSDFHLHLLISVCIAGLLVTALNLTFGYAGQLSLAVGAFYGLGAYIAVNASERGWNGLVALSVATLACFVVAVPIALVAFRARGFYFALITAGLSLLAYDLFVEFKSFTGGLIGKAIASSFDIGPVTIEEPTDHLALAGGSLLVLLLAVSLLDRLGTRRVWEAVREDEILAASLGVQRLRHKTASFAAGAGVAGFAGVLFAYYTLYVSAEMFSFIRVSFEPVVMLVIGGVGTPIGPLVGAALITLAPEVLRPLEESRELVFAGLLLLTVLVAPRGVVGEIVRRAPTWGRRERVPEVLGSPAAEGGEPQRDASTAVKL